MLREKQGGSDSSMIMEGQENQGQTGEGQENQGQTGEGQENQGQTGEGQENQGQNGEGEEAQGQEGQTAEGSSDEIRYMDNFVSLNDFLPDAIIELRYYTSYNFVGERIDGYEEPVALLTREAAQALREVSDELAEKGYKLKIYDAYRPQQAVDHFVRWAQDLSDQRMKEIFYPEVEKSDLFSKHYISEHSGHSRGSTVDLTLVDAVTGEDVDMGGTFDYFGEISHPDYDGITKEQRENRDLLQNTMKAHGFKSIAQEWWHFTLKKEPYPNLYFTFPVSSDSLN